MFSLRARLGARAAALRVFPVSLPLASKSSTATAKTAVGLAPPLPSSATISASRCLLPTRARASAPLRPASLAFSSACLPAPASLRRLYSSSPSPNGSSADESSNDSINASASASASASAATPVLFHASLPALELSASSLFHVNTSPLVSVQQLPSQLPLLLSLKTIEVTHAAATAPRAANTRAAASAIAAASAAAAAAADTAAGLSVGGATSVARPPVVPASPAFASASVLAAHDLIPIATVVIPFVSATSASAAASGAGGIDVASPAAAAAAAFPAATLLHRSSAAAARPVSAGLMEALLTLLARQETVVAEERWTRTAQGASLGARATMKVLQWMQATLDNTTEEHIAAELAQAQAQALAQAESDGAPASAASVEGPVRLPPALLSWCSALVHSRVHVPSTEAAALNSSIAAAAAAARGKRAPGSHAAAANGAASNSGDASSSDKETPGVGLGPVGAAGVGAVSTRANPLAAVFALRPGMVLTVYGYRAEVDAPINNSSSDNSNNNNTNDDGVSDDLDNVASAAAAGSGSGAKYVRYSPLQGLRQGETGLSVAAIGVSPLPIDGPVGARGTAELMAALEAARETGELDRYYAHLHRRALKASKAHRAAAHGASASASENEGEVAETPSRLPALLRYLLEHECDPAAAAVVTSAAALGLDRPASAFTSSASGSGARAAAGGSRAAASSALGDSVSVFDGHAHPAQPAVVVVLDANQSATGTAAAMLHQQAAINSASADPGVSGGTVIGGANSVDDSKCRTHHYANASAPTNKAASAANTSVTANAPASASANGAIGNTLRPPPPPELPVLAMRFTLSKATSPPAPHKSHNSHGPSVPSALGGGSVTADSSAAADAHAAAVHAQPLLGWMLSEEAAAAEHNHAAVFSVYKAAWEPRAGAELSVTSRVAPVSAPIALEAAWRTAETRGRPRVRSTTDSDISGNGNGNGNGNGDETAEGEYRPRALSPRSHSLFDQPSAALLRPPTDPIFAELARVDSTFAALSAARHARDPLNRALQLLTVTLPHGNPLATPLLPRPLSGNGNGISLFSLTAADATANTDADANADADAGAATAVGAGAPHLLLSAPLPPEATLYALAWPSIVRALFPALSRTRDDLSSLMHASSRVTRHDTIAAVGEREPVSAAVEEAAARPYAPLFPDSRAAVVAVVEALAGAHANAGSDTAGPASAEITQSPAAAASLAASAHGPTALSASAWRQLTRTFAPRFAPELVRDTMSFPNHGVSSNSSGSDLEKQQQQAQAQGNQWQKTAALVRTLPRGARADPRRVVITSAVTQVSGLTGGDRSALTCGATHVTGKTVIITSWVGYPIYAPLSHNKGTGASENAVAADDAESSERGELLGIVPVATLSNKYTVLRGDVHGDYNDPRWVPEDYAHDGARRAVSLLSPRAARARDAVRYELSLTTRAPIAPFLDGLAAEPGSATAVLDAARRRNRAARGLGPVVPASFTLSVPLGLSSAFALVSGDHNPIHASVPLAGISPLSNALEEVRAQLMPVRTATAAGAFDTWASAAATTQAGSGGAGGEAAAGSLVDMNRLIYSRPSRMRARERGAAAVLAAIRHRAALSAAIDAAAAAAAAAAASGSAAESAVAVAGLGASDSSSEAAAAAAMASGVKWIDVMKRRASKLIRNRNALRSQYSRLSADKGQLGAASAGSYTDASASNTGAAASAASSAASSAMATGECPDITVGDDVEMESMLLHTTMPVHGVAMAGVLAAAVREHLASVLAQDDANSNSNNANGSISGSFTASSVPTPVEITGFRCEFIRPVTEGAALTVQVKRVTSQPVVDGGQGSGRFEHTFTYQVRGLGFGLIPLSRTLATPSLAPDAAAAAAASGIPSLNSAGSATGTATTEGELLDSETAEAAEAGAETDPVQLVVTPAPVTLKPTSQWNPSDPLVMKGGFTVHTHSPTLTAFCITPKKPSAALSPADAAAAAALPAAVTAARPVSFFVFGGQGGHAARGAGLARGFLDPSAGADVEGSDAFIDASSIDGQPGVPPGNDVGAAVWRRVTAWAQENYAIPLDHIANFNPSALRIPLDNAAVRWRWRRLLRMVIGGAAADTVERDAVAASQQLLDGTMSSAEDFESDAAVDAHERAQRARAVRDDAIASTAAQFHIPHWLLERYADVVDGSVEHIMLLGPATPTAPTGLSLAVLPESARQGLLCHTHFQQLTVWTQEVAVYAQTQANRRAAALTAAAAASDEGVAQMSPLMHELDPGALYAGHSLGEFSAVAALCSDLDPAAADCRGGAGSRLPLEALAELVFLRGWLLQRCVPRDALGRSRLAMAAVLPAKLPFLSPAALAADPDSDVLARAVAEAKGCLERSASYSSVSSYRVHLGEAIQPRWYEQDDPYAYYLRLLAEVAKIEVGRALAMMKETLLRVPERHVRSDPGLLLEVVNHNSAGQQYMLAGSHLLLETFRQTLNGLFRHRTVPTADALVTIIRSSATAAVGDARADITRLLSARNAEPVIPASFSSSALSHSHQQQQQADAAAAAAAAAGAEGLFVRPAYSSYTSANSTSRAAQSNDAASAAALAAATAAPYAVLPTSDALAAAAAAAAAAATPGPNGEPGVPTEEALAKELAKLVAAASEDAFPRLAEADAQFGDEVAVPTSAAEGHDDDDTGHIVRVPFVPFGQIPAAHAPTAPRVRSWLCAPRSSRASVAFTSVDTPFHTSMLHEAVAPFRVAIARVLRGGSVYAEPEPGTAEPDLSGLSGRYVPNLLGDVVFALSHKDASLASSAFVLEAARKLGFVLPNGYSVPVSTMLAELLSRQLAMPVLWTKTQALIASRLPNATSDGNGNSSEAVSSSGSSAPALAPQTLGVEISPEPVLGPMLQRYLTSPAVTAAGAVPLVTVKFATNPAERAWLVAQEQPQEAAAAEEEAADAVAAAAAAASNPGRG